jgi:hypothetical protein
VCVYYACCARCVQATIYIFLFSIFMSIYHSLYMYACVMCVLISYCAYLICMCHLVDEDLLQAASVQFDILDRDKSGTLTIADIEAYEGHLLIGKSRFESSKKSSKRLIVVEIPDKKNTPLPLFKPSLAQISPGSDEEEEEEDNYDNLEEKGEQDDDGDDRSSSDPAFQDSKFVLVYGIEDSCVKSTVDETFLDSRISKVEEFV